MDFDRFDGFVRIFGHTRSRRQTLRGLAGVLAVGALALGEQEADAGNRIGGSPCTRGRQCKTGKCVGDTGQKACSCSKRYPKCTTSGSTCQSGACTCPADQTPCGNTCIATDACCTNSIPGCPNTQSCNDGTCGCGDGQKLCGVRCIATTACCSNNTPGCPGNQVCGNGTCGCDAEKPKLCGNTCIASSECCTNNTPGCDFPPMCCTTGVCCLFCSPEGPCQQ